MQKKLRPKNLKHNSTSPLKLIKDKDIPQVKVDDRIIIRLLNYSNSIQMINFKSIDRRFINLN